MQVQYVHHAIVTIHNREVLVPFELTNFGAPYKTLHEGAVGGCPVWLAESANNFDNPFAKANQKIFDERGYWAEIFGDRIPAQEGRMVGDRLELTCIAEAGTEHQREIKVLAPPNGYYVPTGEGMFHHDDEGGILVPYATVADRKEAVRQWEHAGLDTNYVSRFYRLDSYKDDERFVGRYFVPDRRDFGRFDVYAYRRPSNSGDDWVAARPRTVKLEADMKPPARTL